MTTKKNNVIRLTESRLRRLIKETVDEAFSEWYKEPINAPEYMCIGQTFDDKDEAMEWLQYGDFSEYEPEPCSIKYAKYIDSNDSEGIDLYYDYGADYYFFVLQNRQ